MSKWEFLELSKLCDLEKGKTGLMKAKEGEYTLVATGKDRRTCDTYQFDTKAVCVPLVSSTGHGHASLKYVHYQEGKFALGTILVAIIPKDENILNAQFLHLYLSRLKDIVLVPLMTGAANVTLTVTKLKTVKVPLPPIEEQLRIVSLFNRMDNEQAELTSEITHQQTLLKKLRQSILQEAIEGKLTISWREQNPDVESASVLLEKIKQEKEQLVKDKKIKKQKSLAPINKNEIPFDIPNSWEWCRLGDIGEAKIGLTYKPSDISDNGVIVLRSSNIKNGNIDLNDLVKVKVDINDNKLTDIGDILICARNGSKRLVGKSALIKEKGMSFGAFMSVFRSEFHHYIYTFLQSNIFRIQFDDEKSTGINQLTQGVLRSIIIPFPPLEEQKEIVKKIENLFKICDELETQINSSKTNSQTLMQAVLKEAFENEKNNEENIPNFKSLLSSEYIEKHTQRVRRPRQRSENNHLGYITMDKFVINNNPIERKMTIVKPRNIIKNGKVLFAATPLTPFIDFNHFIDSVVSDIGTGGQLVALASLASMYEFGKRLATCEINDTLTIGVVLVLSKYSCRKQLYLSENKMKSHLENLSFLKEDAIRIDMKKVNKILHTLKEEYTCIDIINEKWCLKDEVKFEK